MKITKEFLRGLDPCEDGFEYWIKTKEPDLAKFMIKAWEYGRGDWANWLFVRSVDRKTRLKYAVYAAEQVLYLFEEKYTDDDRPRKAIEAAKECIKNNTKKNRAAAADAADAADADAADAAAYAYAVAAYAADAAAYADAAAADAAAYADAAAAYADAAYAAAVNVIAAVVEWKR